MKKIILRTIFVISLFPLTLLGEDVAKHPILKSFIIPGTGEASIGYSERGRTFIIAEATLWLSVVGSFLISNMEENKYIAYAAEYGGVNIQRKDRLFWVDIGNYDSRDDFIQEHLRFRDYAAVNRYRIDEDSDPWDWQWDTSKHQERFESMRISSDKWALTGQFLIGGIILNHVISAIDVMYLKRMDAIESVSVAPTYHPENRTFSFSLIVDF
ncbi:MAG: hypothetical protein H8E64_01045 [Candidatus Marinimicrobia bacterium]|nr:hypothetical protein [Candidatus Neomarinimicrobiota bacterium]